MICFNAYDDLIIGDSEANQFTGGSGNDVLVAASATIEPLKDYSRTSDWKPLQPPQDHLVSYDINPAS
jgi:hypothetical protein